MEQSKILVVTDTTSGWNEADAQKAGVALVALSVLLDDKEYKDQIEMRANELYAAQAEAQTADDFTAESRLFGKLHEAVEGSAL